MGITPLYYVRILSQKFAKIVTFIQDKNEIHD